MKYFKSILLAIILVSPISANAAAVVLGFDDATTAPLNPYSSNGFELQGSLLGGSLIPLSANLGQSDTFNFGKDYLSILGETAGVPNAANISITSTSGAAFTLNSIDLGSISSTEAVDITLSSFDILGNFISQTFFNLTELTQISLTQFAGVTNVNVTTAFSFSTIEPITSFSLDNVNITPLTIVVSTVPVPAAAWLFGSALLGFFGFSRRRKTI